MPQNGTIGLVDYGMGNLRSVSKAIEHLGGSVYVGSDPKKLSRFQKLILPGVGAFGDAMKELKKRSLISVLQKAAQNGKMLFGICLGLQLFFERSQESPSVKGLGIWKGTVVRLPKRSGIDFKIPHMGWNQVQFRRRPPIFNGVEDGAHFYFVHSYYVVPKDGSVIATETEYPRAFCSSIWRDRLFAVQFHPEKSQAAGLRLLKNFAEL